MSEETPASEKPATRAKQAQQKAEFILSRAYGLLRRPTAEWEQIRDEETTAASIMLGYVAPLAAIPPVAGVIGQLAFARGEVQTPATQILIGALVSFIAVVAVVFFLGVLTNAIAENFDARPHEMNALKLAAYSPTPWMLLSVVSIIPSLWWVALIGLPVTAFLIYRGLPVLMRCPPDRAQQYTATLLIVGMVAFILIFALSSCFTGGASNVVTPETVAAPAGKS